MDEKGPNNIELPTTAEMTTTSVMDDNLKGEIPEESVSLIEKETKPDEGFGEKEITFFGGWSLLLNNITGPAMTVIPIIYQEAGWFTPTLGILFIMVVSSLSSMMLCRAMTLIPGNDKFQARHELISLAKFYLPRWGYWATLVLFLISLQANNIASIVESAQTMDLALVAAFNYTGALEAYPHPGWAHANSHDEIPFNGAFVLSIGFVVVLMLCLPMGYFNLDDNIIVQEVSLWLFFVILIQWFIDFFLVGFCRHVPVIGSDHSHVLGTVIFNYAFVITIPSWVNEKKAGVSIPKTIWAATGVSTILYIIIGWMGASVFRLGDSETLLTVINNQCGHTNSTLSTPSFCPHTFGKIWQVLSRVLVYLFPAVVLMSGIPVFSIIVRYNLIQTNLCGKAWANFWAVVFPWMLAVVVYTGTGLQQVINWTSLLVNGLVNFIIPILLYIFSENAAMALAAAADYAPPLSAPQACEDVEEAGHHGHAHHEHGSKRSHNIQATESELAAPVVDQEVEVLPPSFQPILIGWAFVGIMTILILITIGLNIATTISPALFEPKNETVSSAFTTSSFALARFRYYYR